MTREEAHKILERAAAQLGEHFDSVALIATFQTSGPEGQTESSWCWSGNMYANLAAVQEAAEHLKSDAGRSPVVDDDEDD